MSDRQISVESLIQSYRDELATVQQRCVEQQAYVRSLEAMNAELLEKVRSGDGQDAEAEPVEPVESEGRAKQNGKAKAGSTRR